MEPAVITQVLPRLMVQLDSSTTSVPALHVASYTPTNGDRVAVEALGARLLVLGLVMT